MLIYQKLPQHGNSDILYFKGGLRHRIQVAEKRVGCTEVIYDYNSTWGNKSHEAVIFVYSCFHAWSHATVGFVLTVFFFLLLLFFFLFYRVFVKGSHCKSIWLYGNSWCGDCDQAPIVLHWLPMAIYGARTRYGRESIIVPNAEGFYCTHAHIHNHVAVQWINYRRSMLGLPWESLSHPWLW